MAGLYIHIPFCRSKCAYCDFYSLPSAVAAADYVDALLAEAVLRRDEIAEPVRTVYLGGGTPSLLPDRELTRLIEGMYDVFGCRHQLSEFTIEANPEDISDEKISLYLKMGIDRVSIGVQSFNQELLDGISRKHSSQMATSALQILKESGINYNADLMYGLPGETMAMWKDDLAQLLGFRPPHLSAYLLSYEPGTRLWARKQRGVVKEVSDMEAEMMYRCLCEDSAKAGYRHYEISNFCQPDCYARHNSGYWQYVPYLGLGVAAHSFDGVVRRYNPPNIHDYILSLCPASSGLRYDFSAHGKELPATVFRVDEETLVNRINDYIITTLRTDCGLSLPEVEKLFGCEMAGKLHANIYPYERLHNALELTEECRIRIRPSLWLQSNTILLDLIL